MKKSLTHLGAGMSMLAVLALSATGCGNSASSATQQPAGSTLTVAHANALSIFDGKDLSLRATVPTEEFTRLNAAGDGRHVLVTTSRGFEVLDSVQTSFTGAVFGATTPGHVVRHAGLTVLFDDGTGSTTIFESGTLAGQGAQLPGTRVVKAEHAHHGVSVVLADGTMLTTVGTEESREGAKALDAKGKQIAGSDQCPGIHGEGTAAGEAVVFGCEDGALLYHDGHFDKFKAPDEYGRMGNAYTAEGSEWVVGDYKNDPDDEGYLLDALTVINTAKHSYEVLPLPEGIQYTWRGVVRGANANAYILGTDGAIHELDPSTGTLLNKFPVLDPWQGPSDWQQPHPALSVNGNTAYVADPENQQIHAIDLATGDKIASTTVAGEPNEMAVVAGH